MNGKHLKQLALRASTVLMATVAVTIAGGTAFAYWTSPGTGDGSATAGTAQALTGAVAAVVPSSARLYPTGPAVSGTVVITNPNPFNVQIDSVTWTGTTVDAAHRTACATTGVTFTWTDTSGSLKLAKNNGTATLNYTASMDNSSDNGCQGATFTGAFTIGATSLGGGTP